MKLHPTQHLFAAALVAFAGSAIAAEDDLYKPAQVNTKGMPDYLRAQIEAKAHESQLAVIQYLNRTRMIHSLYVRDVIRTEDNAAMAKGAPQDAVRVTERAEAQQPKN